MRPILSIVIANYNYGQYLEQAIRSVVDEHIDGVELIVVDGGSTDASVQIIKRYAQYIAWWCSEKDKGQSDAFNKGFSHATGEYLTWLNADDVFLPNSLKHVTSELSAAKIDWATANFIRFSSETGRVLEAKWGPHYLPGCLQGNGWPVAVYGPSTFFRKEVYDRLGPIRVDFSYSMDTEYWTRMTVNGIKQVRINIACWAFRMHEASKTAEYNGHSCSATIKRRQEEEFNLRMALN